MRVTRACHLRLALSAAAAIAIVAVGCDESTAPETEEEFILTVWVTNAAETPRVGVHVGRLNHLEGDIPDPPAPAPGLKTIGPAGPALADSLLPAYPNPFEGRVNVRFLTADTREAALDVVDWRGRHVRTLADGRFPAGAHTILWNQRDGFDERVINGVYRLRLSLCDTLAEHQYCFVDSIECTVYDLLDPNRTSVGTTDETGFFSTRDLDLFPSLQGHAPQIGYDETGDPTGLFSFSAVVTIRLSTEPDPMTGKVYLMSRDIELVNGPNFRHFIFAPDDSFIAPRAR